MTSDQDERQYGARLLEAATTINRLRERLHDAERRGSEPIAVVGMALRLPGGARTPAQFWSLLREGVNTAREFPAARADAQSVFHPDPEHPGTAYVIRGSFIEDDVAGFDPAVFGISPREAVGMDPQQRIILEIAWEALESAGYAPTGLAGSRTGVYVGVSTTDYVRARQQSGDIRDVDAYQLVGEPSFIAGRVSFTFGLRGPSQVIDTTCSSSLVAVHEASQALRAGECDMALAGGVSLMLSPYGFVLMSKFRALAADGRCKTFDAAADGYARGEGAGVVVLKRLTDALAGRDSILAVIRGSAVNHDGRSSGLTVPSPEAQQQVMRQALRQAGVDGREASYVEAHGTGTSLGDPIELGALDAVYGPGRSAAEPLLVGSVKTNIGHLEPAAGIAGLLKVILALRHQEIPPHLNLTTPNPKVPWRRLRIEVPTTLVPWQRDGGKPKIAAVSSFGASGTNAHVLVSDMASAPAGREEDCGPGVLVLSARTGTALRELARRYAGYLSTTTDRLADVCFTSKVGRARHEHGLVLSGDSQLDMAERLTRFAGHQTAAQATEVRQVPYQDRKMAWLLTGQGAQYPGMAAGLRSEPAFARPFRECAELLDPLLPQPLEAVLWGEPDAEKLGNTQYTQTALFAVEYALGRALLDWEVRPSAMLGHSVGEITAACLAGAISLADAARLVAHRARLMATLPAGGVMAAVGCGEPAAREAIASHGAEVAIAAVNGPADIVLSGPGPQVRAVTGALAQAGHRARQLRVSHAFHSPLIEPMLEEFAAELKTITVRQPDIPLISNVTGKPWTSAELDPRYWLRHAVGTVRFHDGLRQLYADGVRTFAEVGPQPVLTGLGRKVIDDAGCAWLGLLRRGTPDRLQLRRGLAVLHLRGSRIGWDRVYEHHQVRRVPGPSYPWEHQRYWFKTDASLPAAAGDTADGLGTRVRGPDPVYEQQLGDGEALTHADCALGWLAERSVRAAGGLGGRWQRLAAARAEPVVLHEARGPWLVQTAVRPQAGGAAAVTTTGAHPDSIRAGAPWQPHGHVTVHRTPVAVPEDAGPDGDGPAPRPVPPADGEAAAWGAVIQAACRAAGEAAGVPGWAAAFDLAQCQAPARVREVRVARSRTDGDTFIADVWLLGDGDERIGEISGLRWSPVPGPAPVRWFPTSELVYRVAWVPAGTGPALATGERQRVLLAGPDDVLPRLADQLRQLGASQVRVHADHAATDSEIDEWLAAGPTRIVVSGPGLPAGLLGEERLTSHVLAAEQLVVRLVQRIAAGSWPAGPPRLVLLTRGAVPGSEQDTVNPAGSTLWGLAGVVALEHPDYWGCALDLDPSGQDDLGLAALAVLACGPEDQCALRQRQWLVPRLRPVPPDTLPPPSQRQPHRPGTVLITGGWGGIGTAVAAWLARSGTQRLVLAGRSGLPDERDWGDPGLPAQARAKIAILRQLRELGTEVVAAQLDVTDEAQVRALVAELAAGPLPLRGVIHAAGVSAPQDLTGADTAAYHKVWAPKTIGAWALHTATSALDLDFFVCFSSIAATWGSQHLASYSAGNMFLDGLAHHRRGLGLPCLTVDWGPWGLASHLFGDDVMSFLEAVGLRRLHPGQCLSLLERLLRTLDPQYVVCAADWGTYKPVMEARTDRPVFRDIVIADDAGPGDKDEELLRGLAAQDGSGPEATAARQALLAGFLAAATAEALGVDPASVATGGDVFALGLDSLMVMEVAAKCRRRLGVQVRPADFYNRSTLTGWAAYLDQVMHGDSEASGGFGTAQGVAARAVLDPGIRPASPPPPGGHPARARPRTVLLTGATGFVGAFLLDELLRSTSAEVVCLARCSSESDGLARVRAAVERYLPWRHEEQGRIRVCPGDLAQPGLGLPQARFADLGRQVDAIYHAGAWVDFVHTFEQLAPANIGGTAEILRLACLGGDTPVNHVSTYGIWGLPVDGRVKILESGDIATAGRLVTGYVQTKWGAEHIAAQGRDRGIDVRTFRLGRVLGDSGSGVCLTTHFTCRVIKGCIQLGLAPDLGDLEVEMTPADYVARALVHISRTSTADQVFHLVNPVKMPFAQLVRFIQRHGWPLRVIGRQEWWEALSRTFDAGGNALHPVMDTVREFVVGGEEAIDYDVACAEKALAGSGIHCPPLDERLLETYFGYFTASGYLPKPDKPDRPSAQRRKHD